MNLQFSMRSHRQEEIPLNNMCSLFGNNRIQPSPRKYSKSPQPPKGTKKKIKCPQSKLSQQKNIHTERPNKSPAPPPITIVRSPQHFSTLQFNQQRRRQEYNLTTIFQPKHKSPLPVPQLKPILQRNPKQMIRTIVPPTFSPRYFAVQKNPEMKIQFSKATTLNTERTENTMKKYKSLEEFEPITARSLVNSRVDSVFETKESEIMIDFFNEKPPSTMQNSKDSGES